MGPAFSLASTLGVMVVAAGALTLWALLAMCAIMLLLALTFAQLSARFPDAGSSYAWARRAFGEGAGAYTAWILILANFFAVLATAIPAGVYTLELIAPRLVDAPVWEAVVGSVWIVGCALVLFAGMRPTALVAALLLAAELAVLSASVVAAYISPFPAMRGVEAHTGPAVGVGGFIAAMVLGIWMVDGWEVSAATSEESRGTATAGTGGILGLLLTAAILVACSAAYLRVGVGGIAAREIDVLAFVGERLGGAWKTILVATVLVSLAAALQTTLLYLVRSVYAMGRDGVLPRALGRLGMQTRDPDIALVAVTVAVLGATLLVGFVPTANAALEIVLNGTAIFLGLLFVTSCAAALRLRDKETPFFAAAAGLALLAILGVALMQAAPATRWCVIAGLVAGVPVALAHAARTRGQVRTPAAGNIGG